MPSRERTSYFLKATEAIRASSPAKPAKPVIPSQKKSPFSVQAANIRASLNATTTKLQKLAKLASSKSYAFGDPIKDIDELSFVIKEDIIHLQRAVQDMQAELRSRQKGESKQEQEHSATVVSSLKNSLATATQNFSQVLNQQAQSMQEKQDRRVQFSNPNSATRAGGSRNNLMLAGCGGEDEDDDENDDCVLDMGQLVQVNPQNEYHESRAIAVENIQKTMLELGEVFTQLALTVEMQKLQMQAIDQNTEVAIVHVNDAQNMWVQYLDSISSNRMLAMKVFGILMTFALFFIVFLK